MTDPPRRAYLRPARRGGSVTAYSLINPWRDEAIVHVEAMTAYHKEVERQRKATKRASLPRPNIPGREAEMSLQILPGHEPGCPGKICRPVPAEFAAYYPSGSTPKKRGSRKDKGQGAEIINITNHLRRPA